MTRPSGPVGDRVPSARQRCAAGGRAALGLALLLGACSPYERIERRAGDNDYFCEDGHELRAAFLPVQGRVALTTASDALTLTRAPAESGSRYASPNGWELWVDGDEASFTFPGGRRTLCHTGRSYFG